MALKVDIVTPEAQIASFDCEELIAPGIKGEIGVLPGHVAIVTALAPGVLTLVRSGKKSYYAVSAGYAEVTHDHVSILTDACEESAAIDVERAKKARREAEEALLTTSAEDPAHAEQARRLARANARLDAAERR